MKKNTQIVAVATLVFNAPMAIIFLTVVLSHLLSGCGDAASETPAGQIADVAKNDDHPEKGEHGKDCHSEPVLDDAGEILGATITCGDDEPVFLPKGEKGDKGDPGETGKDGAPGAAGRDGVDAAPAQDGEDAARTWMEAADGTYIGDILGTDGKFYLLREMDDGTAARFVLQATSATQGYAFANGTQIAVYYESADCSGQGYARRDAGWSNSLQTPDGTFYVRDDSAALADSNKTFGSLRLNSSNCGAVALTQTGSWQPVKAFTFPVALTTLQAVVVTQ